MARVISRSNELKNKVGRFKTGMIISVSFTVMVFLLWTLNIVFIRSFNPIFLFFTFVCFGAGGFSSVILFNGYSRYKAGLDGEERVQNLVSELPDSYVGITNAKVCYQNKSSELDMVVVGPTGIFVIEVKNHKGTICGNYNDQYLCYNKISSGGNCYQSSMYNPVRQVGTHTYRLSHFLKANGVTNWINSIVYFANPQAIVELNGTEEGAKVFDCMSGGYGELKQYTVGADRNTMTSEEINKAVSLLVRC